MVPLAEEVQSYDPIGWRCTRLWSHWLKSAILWFHWLKSAILSCLAKWGEKVYEMHRDYGISQELKVTVDAPSHLSTFSTQVTLAKVFTTLGFFLSKSYPVPVMHEQRLKFDTKPRDWGQHIVTAVPPFDDKYTHLCHSQIFSKGSLCIRRLGRLWRFRVWKAQIWCDRAGE